MRSVYLAFEFERDAHRRKAFIHQAKTLCDFELLDKSLPAAEHNSVWQRRVLPRIQASDVVIVLLGRDTHNSPGVLDELSLAGQVRCPVVQLMPQHCNYGLVSENGTVCIYRWKRINEMLRDPLAFANNPANHRR